MGLVLRYLLMLNWILSTCALVYTLVFVAHFQTICLSNLVTVMDSRGNLSEDASGFCFWQPLPLLYVVVQLPSAGVFHHYHDLIPTLEHCQHRTWGTFYSQESRIFSWFLSRFLGHKLRRIYLSPFDPICHRINSEINCCSFLWVFLWSSNDIYEI